MENVPRGSDGRRLFSPEFKREQVGRLLRGELTLTELSQELGISLSVLQRWKHLIAQGGETAVAASEDVVPASEAIVTGLIGTNTVRVSALNVVEAARTPDSGRRVSLLHLLRRMTGGFRPLEMPNTLARRTMTAYSRRSPFLGSSIDSDSDMLLGMLIDPSIADDDARRELDAGQEQLESEFVDCHHRARPHFQDLFRDGALAPRRAAPLIRHFMRSTQFLHGDVVNPIFRQQTGVDLPTSEMGELFRVAPEVAGFLLGWAHSIHKRSIALEGFGSRNAGIVDLWYATYLGRVDRFITADERQYKVLRLVARVVAPGCVVVRFHHFRRRPLGNL